MFSPFISRGGCNTTRLVRPTGLLTQHRLAPNSPSSSLGTSPRLIMSKRGSASQPQHDKGRPSSPIRRISPPPAGPETSHAHSHSHDSHNHDGHSHSIFHSHSHDHSEGAEQLISAISSGKLDRGTRITLLGLASNVALTAGKGVAGLAMNSASLLAEAGHSLSDLLGVSLGVTRGNDLRSDPELTLAGLCHSGYLENISAAPFGNVSLGVQ
jgi:hypothetical protein